MSFKRAAFCLPVLAGLVLTGSAVARMAPATGDDATPSCDRNGVHPNPQGHPSCGLHLGWSNAIGTVTDEASGEPGTEPAGEPAEDQSPGDETPQPDEGTAGEPMAEKVCKNHEVRLNKNGHPTCGLHKGWDKHQPAPTATSDTPADTGGSQGSKDKPQKAAHAHGAGHGASHAGTPGGKAGKHSH